MSIIYNMIFINIGNALFKFELIYLLIHFIKLKHLRILIVRLLPTINTLPTISLVDGCVLSTA